MRKEKGKREMGLREDETLLARIGKFTYASSNMGMKGRGVVGGKKVHERESKHRILAFKKT